MRALPVLAAKSAWSRRFAMALVVACVALATFLLLAVERLRHDTRASFADAVSGADLIVGARGGSVQLLLYSVFRIGGATNNIRWSSVQALQNDPAVAWVVPISLGDSHRGFPVVATSVAYFERFRYADQRALAFREGRAFTAVFDAVLGSEVAARLGYRLGDRMVLAHGDGAIADNDHADLPFTVVGILAPTGTPVDRSVHIGLDGMEAIHLDWAFGAPLPGRTINAEQAATRDLAPKAVTAALLGLKSRAAVFAVQRRIAEFPAEPLQAVLPGVALDELWEAVSLGERALGLVGAVVAVVSLAGLVAAVVVSLEQRRRELAVLRAIGMGPRALFALLGLEGAMIAGAGVAAGLALWCLAFALAAPWVQAQFGVGLSAAWPGAAEWRIAAAVFAAGVAASVVPGWRAYRLSLADGLSPRGA
jgi:putative ABC transport system permease protein